MNNVAKATQLFKRLISACEEFERCARGGTAKAT